MSLVRTEAEYSSCVRPLGNQISGNRVSRYCLDIPGSDKSVCFFFQAEDGIRYHCVTGVQTCALPISQPRLGKDPGPPGDGPRGPSATASLALNASSPETAGGLVFLRRVEVAEKMFGIAEGREVARFDVPHADFGPEGRHLEPAFRDAAAGRRQARVPIDGAEWLLSPRRDRHHGVGAFGQLQQVRKQGGGNERQVQP